MSILKDLTVAAKMFKFIIMFGNFRSAKGHYSRLAILFYRGNKFFVVVETLDLKKQNKKLSHS